MAIKPVVRYMILCDNWTHDPSRNNRVTIHGLLTNVKSRAEPPYPVKHRELCIFLSLTEGYGRGKGKVTIVFEETGEEIFSTSERFIEFPLDPLSVFGVGFRIQDCRFPGTGLYSVQFWYDGDCLEERPLLLR